MPISSAIPTAEAATDRCCRAARHVVPVAADREVIRRRWRERAAGRSVRQPAAANRRSARLSARAGRAACTLHRLPRGRDRTACAGVRGNRGRRITEPAPPPRPDTPSAEQEATIRIEARRRIAVSHLLPRTGARAPLRHRSAQQRHQFRPVVEAGQRLRSGRNRSRPCGRSQLTSAPSPFAGSCRRSTARAAARRAPPSQRPDGRECRGRSALLDGGIVGPWTMGIEGLQFGGIKAGGRARHGGRSKSAASSTSEPTFFHGVRGADVDGNAATAFPARSPRPESS